MNALAGLLASLASSFTGRSMGAVALGWLVVDRTGSARLTGMVAAATLLPLVGSGLLGGWVIDRVGARRVGITADLSTAAAIAAIPVADLLAGAPAARGAGLPALPWILAFAFAAGASQGCGGPAREALLPAVIRHARVRLERANATYKAVEAATLLLGPLVAGLLIAGAGARVALAAAGAAFALAALVTTTAVRPRAAGTAPAPTAPTASEPTAPEPTAPEPTAPGARPDQARSAAFVLAGLRFVWADRTIRAMALAGAVLIACSASFSQVVLPVHLNRSGDAAGLGLALAALGAGLVLGVLFFGVAGFRLPRRALALGCLGVIAAARTVMILLPPLPWLIALIAVDGLVAGPLNPLILTILQERTPPGLRGRVFGGVGALFLGVAPLGVLVAGVVIDAVGLRPTLAGLAAVFAATSLIAACSPGLRDLSMPKQVAAAVPEGPELSPSASPLTRDER